MNLIPTLIRRNRSAHPAVTAAVDKAVGRGTLQLTTYQAAILDGLGAKPSGEVYGGSVSWQEKDRRRAAGKRARAARRLNRR